MDEAYGRSAAGRDAVTPAPAACGGRRPTVILRALRDNKWNIDAIIEFEYPVPEGSDRMAEMAKCMEYCKRALTTRT